MMDTVCMKKRMKESEREGQRKKGSFWFDKEGQHDFIKQELVIKVAKKYDKLRLKGQLCPVSRIEWGVKQPNRKMCIQMPVTA